VKEFLREPKRRKVYTVVVAYVVVAWVLLQFARQDYPAALQELQ